MKKVNVSWLLKSIEIFLSVKLSDPKSTLKQMIAVREILKIKRVIFHQSFRVGPIFITYPFK